MFWIISQEPKTTKRVVRYLHDDSDELSELWPPEAPQQEVYAYALYEVMIELDVNMKTGQSTIVAVDGRELSP